MISFQFGMMFSLFYPLLLAFNTSNFSLRATVIEAFEDGPVVIEVEMRYRGQREIETHAFFDSSNRVFGVFFENVSNWRKRDPIQFGPPGHRGGLRPLQSLLRVKPGAVFRKTFFLHHKYSSIPTGKALLKLHVKIAFPFSLQSRNLGERGPQPILIAIPQTQLEISVQKGTKERLSRIKTEIEDELLNNPEEPTWGPALEKWYAASDRLLWIERKEFALLALKVLAQMNPSDWTSNRYRPYIYSWAKASEDVRVALVKYLARNGTGGDTVFIEQWESDRVQLSPNELEQLHNANDLWIRAASYALEPEGNRSGLNGVLEDLERLRKHVEAVERRKPPP